MFSSVTYSFVIFLVVAALAEGKGPGPRRRGHPASLLFPACKEFIDAMDQNADKMYRTKQIFREPCKEENMEECVQTGVMKVRCSVAEIPSDACMAEFKAFLQADACNE